MTWNHETVYDALVSREGGSDKSLMDQYAFLYAQSLNCAILYSPDSPHYRKKPLHLNPGRSSWQPDIYKKIVVAIKSVKLEGKPIDPFLHCEVSDWTAFAEQLGLNQ